MAMMLPRNCRILRKIKGITGKRSLISLYHSFKRYRNTSSISCTSFESTCSQVLPLYTANQKDNKENFNKINKNSLLYAFGFLSLAYAMSEEENENIGAILDVADSLYEKNEIKQLYENLSKEKHHKNAEILWRFARAARDYSQLSSTPSDLKKKLTYEGYAASEEAIKLGDKLFACHKWYGIMLSEIGDYEGTKKKIENSYKIRDHFKKAIELNPADATSHYLLGVWYFTFADLPWYQRKLAATIFASPPSCTYEEALDCFLHAETIDPGFYTANQLMIAKSYLKLGKKEEAKFWIDKLLHCQAITESDKKTIAEGEGLSKSL